VPPSEIHRHKFLEVPIADRRLSPICSPTTSISYRLTPAALPSVKSGQTKGIAIWLPSEARRCPAPTTESGVPNLEIDS
jgi:hypothetical protein